MGLRDYSRWANPVLPGKVGGSDLDFVLHQESSGRVLVMEFKEPNKRLSVGQRMLLRALKQMGIEVWLAWGPYADGTYKAGAMDDLGEVPFLQQMTEAELGAKVRNWWHTGTPQP